MTRRAGSAATVRMEVAGPADDPELRRLLRDNPMPGAIALSLQREPDFFLGATIEGDVHFTVLGRDLASGRLAGLGSMARYDGFVGGRRHRLGYFSQLRIDAHYRGHGLLAGGFAKWREIHEQGDVRFYVTTVFEANAAGRGALEKDRPGQPCYRPRGVLSTLALPLWRRRPPRVPAGLAVRPATAADLEAIAACLQRNYARFDFAPDWTVATLGAAARTRDLEPEDFAVALRGRRLVGCLATWDQQGFKQTVVHRYRGALACIRPVVNLAGPLVGWPRLPREGEALRHAFLSHVAVDDDDPEVFLALATHAFNAAVGREYAYLTLGFTQGHALLPAAKRAFQHLEYRSIIYVVYWDDGARAVADLEPGRLPFLEVAVL